MHKQQTVHYQEVPLSELSPSDHTLIEHAMEATRNAYSPYSHFRVGAALQLADGTIVTGSNQENVAYRRGCVPNARQCLLPPIAIPPRLSTHWP